MTLETTALNPALFNAMFQIESFQPKLPGANKSLIYGVLGEWLTASGAIYFFLYLRSTYRSPIIMAQTHQVLLLTFTLTRFIVVLSLSSLANSALPPPPGPPPADQNKEGITISSSWPIWKIVVFLVVCTYYALFNSCFYLSCVRDW